MKTRFWMVAFGFLASAIGGCGDSDAMSGAGGVGGIPTPPDNPIVVTFADLVDACEGPVARSAPLWPFDCNVTPGVHDARLFDGDCACNTTMWMHEQTGLFACQELPSTCGGATIFDVAGFPLLGPVWDDVEFYSAECCGPGGFCSDPDGLADAEASLPGCATNWTSECALRLQLSAPPSKICPFNYAFEMRNVDMNLFMNLDDGPFWPADFELQPAPDEKWKLGRSQYGGNFFTLTTARPGFCEPSGPQNSWNCPDNYRMCLESLPSNSTRMEVFQFDSRPSTSSSFEGGKCTWLVEQSADGTFTLTNRSNMLQFNDGELGCMNTTQCSVSVVGFVEPNHDFEASF